MDLVNNNNIFFSFATHFNYLTSTTSLHPLKSQKLRQCNLCFTYFIYLPVFYISIIQTDILLTEIKVITDLFVIVIREIYVHVYTRMLVC